MLRGAQSAAGLKSAKYLRERPGRRWLVFFFGSRFIVQRQYVTMLHITRVERLVGYQLGTPFRDSKE